MYFLWGCPGCYRGELEEGVEGCEEGSLYQLAFLALHRRLLSITPRRVSRAEINKEPGNLLRRGRRVVGRFVCPNRLTRNAVPGAFGDVRKYSSRKD